MRHFLFYFYHAKYPPWWVTFFYFHHAKYPAWWVAFFYFHHAKYSAWWTAFLHDESLSSIFIKQNILPDQGHSALFSIKHQANHLSASFSHDYFSTWHTNCPCLNVNLFFASWRFCVRKLEIIVYFWDASSYSKSKTVEN